MLIKDYYTILELDPSATLPEIKKAYRRLAQQYHPDKNHQDPYATAQFAEIKEAYETLTNPGKKEYYLQQRWYDQSTGKRKKQPVITPVSILKQVLELEKYVARLDHFRMDKQGLHDYIGELMSNDTIARLNEFKEESTNDAILLALLDCLKYLPYPLSLALQQQMSKLSSSAAVTKKMTSQVRHMERAHKRERYKIWVILFLVLLFCLLIIFLEPGT
ncbi:MAG TPA: DnaJ domain-containing protein [Chitinophagaceae bacterium]|jgi:preprotein translocase subunit Sec63|nr:DnaJ domain-containing protein [Chitinophagaceae bacterium]